MRVNLGAAVTLSPDEVTSEDFAGCRHAHIEGYLLFNRELMEAVLTSARQAGCTVSLDLASFEVVSESREILPNLLKDSVDLVFGNEDEIGRLIQSESHLSELAQKLTEWCTIGVVKAGRDGAYLANDGGVVHVPARLIDNPVDTTGAGDAWAAGFLYGYLSGHDLDHSGHLGSVLGSLTVDTLGAHLSDQDWNQLKELIAEEDSKRAKSRNS